MDAATVDVPALALGPDLTIAHAAADRERLLAALAAAPGDLHLSLAGVDEIDSAGVQLLVATGHSLAARGRRLCVADASPAVRDALSLLGLPALAAP